MIYATSVSAMFIADLRQERVKQLQTTMLMKVHTIDTKKINFDFYRKPLYGVRLWMVDIFMWALCWTLVRGFAVSFKWELLMFNFISAK